MLNMHIIKRFINGEIDENEFKENIKEFTKILEKCIDVCGSNSITYRNKDGEVKEIDASKYIESAKIDLGAIDLIEKDEEGELKKLPKEAAICDMCNNLAHASRLIKADTKKITSSLFGLKIAMINEIKKECEMQGNECYGKKYDIERYCETFIVDIPSYGQIAWHLGKEKIDCKGYDFEKEKTDYQNCEFLNRKEIKNDTIKYLPTHTKIVRSSTNYEEMREDLYGRKINVKAKNSEEPISLD